MCLILFVYKVHPNYNLILASNRDEFYERPTEPAAFWKESPELFAGKDLRGGGTWLGITITGRFAAITNFRDPFSLKPNAPTRGHIVSSYLNSNESPFIWLEKLKKDADKYNGFNLLTGDKDHLYYYSNHDANNIKQLEPGIYGLSNEFLDSPWPKVKKGKKELKKLISKESLPSNDVFFNILKNTDQPSDKELPNTGVGLDWERILGPMFIQNPIYGTRSSSLIFINKKGQADFIERSYKPGSDDFIISSGLST